jgi:NAD dependent epimerase/dehydratase family enzyme
VVLEGSRVSNQKIKRAGYAFKFAELDKALINLTA